LNGFPTIVVSQHYALLAGYGTALAGWYVLSRFFPALWPNRAGIGFPFPWREVGWACLGVLGVIAVGQVYARLWRFPSDGTLGPLIEAANQVLIFLPILAMLLLRRQGLRTAWLPMDRVWARLLVGQVLAALAILAFTLVRDGSDNWLAVYPRVYQPKNVAFAVQVLCEDLAIAILFVRFQAAIGLWGTILVVACVFAAAHIPAMITNGSSWKELARLALDAGLGVVVLFVAQRSADVWWLWCVHFAMDMMQFYATTAAPV
jgi:hypothetical protein